MRANLPEGWASARLAELSVILMGQSPPGSTYNEKEEGLPFFQGKTDFAERSPKLRVWCSSPSRVAEPGDVLISVRAPVGPTNVADRTCAIGRGLAAIRPLGGIPTEWILHSLNYSRTELEEQATGSTFTAINREVLESLELVVPPLAEQRRIVAKVEAVLDQVNQVKARLAKVQAILKRFRQAVLAAACSGKLTEEFRNSRKTTSSAPLASSDAEGEFDDLPEGWVWSTLAALAEVVDPQPSHRTPPISPGGIPYVGIGDFSQNGRITLEQTRRVDPHVLQEHQARYSLRVGDFIFGKIGTLGRPMLLPQPFNYVLSANVVLVQPRWHCRPAYLCLFMQSPRVKKLLESGSRATSQAAFGIKRMRNIAVPVPPLEEQDQIVSRARDFMVLADTLQKRLAAAIGRADQLGNAILAKAFSGELVPTEAGLSRTEGRDYEPAEVLLERVRKERANRIAPTKGRGPSLLEDQGAGVRLQ